MVQITDGDKIRTNAATSSDVQYLFVLLSIVLVLIYICGALVFVDRMDEQTAILEDIRDNSCAQDNSTESNSSHTIECSTVSNCYDIEESYDMYIVKRTEVGR
jgi:hypothetical protein